MKNHKKTFLILFSIQLLLFSCTQSGDLVEEKDHPAFVRGKSLLKIGKNKEALDEFLAVTRRMLECPQSHLECGRLFLSLDSRKDPVAAIYHFRRFLLLDPNAKESPKVEQLIITAEREILRKLPGEPYDEYLNSIKLKEENDKLHREISDLRARIGISGNENPVRTNSNIPLVPKPSVLSSSPVSSSITERLSGPLQMETYTVKSGDSLYAISRKFYGDSSRIDLIYEANRDVIRSKNNLSVGQTLRIPPVPSNR